MQEANYKKGSDRKIVLDPKFKIVYTSGNMEEFHTLFEFVPMAVFHVDHAGKVIEINSKAVNLTGYARGELLTLNICHLFPTDAREKSPWLHHATASEHYFSVETEIERKCGTSTPVELNSNVLEDKSVLHFVMDISDRKRVENSLKEREASFRELNATKDKFFSIIAHDLKSPFNAIVGFSAMMSDQIKKNDYDGLEEYAEIIQSSSQRAMELLRDLLEWSRSQTGTMTFHPEYIDMVTLIQETTDLLRDSARHKSISIACELPSNMIVMADRAMINSVLRNLVSNAVKFTHSDGKITVGGEQNLDELIISVKDTGVGIRKCDIQKLFRIDESFTKAGTLNEKGTGLGLILCKEFVDKHGGKMWVDSEPGFGSTFYFTIPMIMY